MSPFNISHPVVDRLRVLWDCIPPVLVQLSDDESKYATPLLKAVYEGNLDTLQSIRFNARSLEAEEGLHIACIKGKYLTFNLIFEFFYPSSYKVLGNYCL